MTSLPRWLAGVLSLAATVGCLLTLPTHAGATQRYLKAIWGDVDYQGVSQFPLYRDLGVDVFQYPLRWADTAPTRPRDALNPADPAYKWPPQLDQAVREAGLNRIQVLIRVSMTPSWANGGKSRIDPPTAASDYADFMAAVARRYPTVHLFMVWEEPNRAAVYRLRGIDNHLPVKPLGRRLKEDVQRYAQLVDATYGTLKRIDRRNKIVGGNSLSLASIDPKYWISALRLRNGKPPRMDYYGHNPMSARRPRANNKQFRPSGADMSDFPVLERWIDRYLSRDGRNKNLPVFISEYTQPTSVRSFQFNWHVNTRLQASYLSDALRLVRNDPRIAAFGWYSLRDLGTDPESGLGSRVGLINRDGSHKPSYDVFKRG